MVRRMHLSEISLNLCIGIFLGCIPVISYGADRAPTNSELKLIKTKLAEKLKDPDSIKITDLKVGGDRSQWVCGMVNGKNSHGGYVGKKPFIGMLDGEGSKQLFAVMSIGESDLDASLILKMCADRIAQ